MKVIQERKAYENWSLQIDCNGKGWQQKDKVPCGSTLEINKDDIVKREWSKWRDEGGIDYGFICPICGCFTVIPEEHLNDDLRNLAKDYKEHYIYAMPDYSGSLSKEQLASLNKEELAAISKNIPMKVANNYTWGNHDQRPDGNCPVCNYNLSGNRDTPKHPKCPGCGQALDWH